MNLPVQKNSPGLWVGQGLHFVCLVILLALTWYGWESQGRPYPFYFWTAIAIPIANQIYVWLTWRCELRTSAISKTIGFKGYVAGFFVLFLGRFVSLGALAWFDRGSLGLPPITLISITVVLVLVGGYAMYSVKRYFGLARASGADHFDPKYRDLPLVKGGIFRFTNNGMYIYAFFLFWSIAVGFNSLATLTVMAFSHVYIWVHFYATEKPDMEFLYGSQPKNSGTMPTS